MVLPSRHRHRLRARLRAEGDLEGGQGERGEPSDGMRILEHLDHLKSQHRRSTYNSTNVRVRMCHFSPSFCP